MAIILDHRWRLAHVHTLCAGGPVIISRLKQAGHTKQLQTHMKLSGELWVCVCARVPVARLAFKGSGESRKCPILQIITCKACTLILDWIWHVFNTHALSQGKRRRLADDRLTFSLFNDALLIPAVNTHSPKHPPPPHTDIYSLCPMQDIIRVVSCHLLPPCVPITTQTSAGSAGTKEQSWCDSQTNNLLMDDC